MTIVHNTALRAGQDPVPGNRRHVGRRADRAERARFHPWQVPMYVLLGGFSLSAVLAFVWIINNSLKTSREFIGTSPWSVTPRLGWDSYAAAWITAKVGSYFWNSLVVSFGATALGLVLSAIAAYPLARFRFRGSGLLLGLFVTGLMVPWMVTFIPLSMLLSDIGLSDSHLGLILVYATYNLPFNVFVLVGFMKGLPYELEEAAAVDGASPARTFVSIIAPLLRPGLASVAIISFLNNWNEFFYALVLITTPGKATLPLGLFQLHQAATYGSNWPNLFAGMVITVVPVLIAYGLMQSRITEGLSVGAVKG